MWQFYLKTFIHIHLQYLLHALSWAWFTHEIRECSITFFFFLLGCSNIQQLKKSGSVFVQINGGRNRRIRKPVYWKVDWKKTTTGKPVYRFRIHCMYIEHVLCASIDYTLCCYITAADSTTNPKCLYHYLCTRHSQADEVRSRYIFFPHSLILWKVSSLCVRKGRRRVVTQAAATAGFHR